MESLVQIVLQQTVENPDSTRRSQLLNVLLAGVGAITLLGMLGTLIFGFEINQIVTNGGLTLLLIIAIFLINRYVSISIASWLFLITLTLIIVNSDLPEEIINGRSLFFFAIPIFMASVLLKPYSTFLITALVTLILNIISFSIGQSFVYIPPLGFFVFSFIAWLSAKGLDEALAELRLINKELDQRVEERTVALQATNDRLQHEVNERIKIEKQLIVARDQAVSASKFKSELMARVSHELRTPLGAILGYLEMLRAGIYGAMMPKQTTMINTIIEINQDLTRLVNELLEQARIESGQIHLDVDWFSPQHLIESTYNNLLVLAQSKGIGFAYDVDKNLPHKLCGDESRLQQILINLVGNALKFTDEGHVSLSAFRVDENSWGLRVQDSGIGMPQKELENIFSEFHQIDHTYTRKHGGFGLGLSIVKRLLTLMDGDIEVKSQEGIGSEFTIQLPIIKEEEKAF